MDRAEGNHLIAELSPLVVNLAKQRCHVYAKKPDAIASGLYFLVRCIRRIESGELQPTHGDIKAYTILTVKRQIIKAIYEDTLIRVPHGSRKNSDFKEARFDPDPSAIKEVVDRSNLNAELITKDIIDSLPDNERMIAQSLMNGYSAADITRTTGLAKSTVSRSIRLIKGRIIMQDAKKWIAEYHQAIKNYPQSGDIILSEDSQPIKLCVEFQEDRDVIIYAHAYVPSKIGSPVGWFCRSIKDSKVSGLKCILTTAVRDKILASMDITAGFVTCKILKVLQMSKSKTSLICEIEEW